MSMLIILKIMNLSFSQIIFFLLAMLLFILILYFLHLIGIFLCKKNSFLKKVDLTKMLILCIILMFFLISVGIDNNNRMWWPSAMGFSFSTWIWALIPSFINKITKKSKKIFEKDFYYGWFGIFLGLIISVFLNEIIK